MTGGGFTLLVPKNTISRSVSIRITHYTTRSIARTMDRARRAEPYSNATIWTREIARNLAGHLARISKAHSCVDTKSPKTRLLPKFQHSSKRCATSPVKARQYYLQQPTEQQLHQSAVKEGDEDGPEQRDDEEDEFGDVSPHASKVAGNEDDSELKAIRRQRKSPTKKVRQASKKSRMEVDRLEIIAHENQRMQERLAKIATPSAKQDQQQHQPRTSSVHHLHPHSQSSDDSMWNSLEKSHGKTSHDYNKKQEQLKIWTENQALAKRLRMAKGTLNCEGWEKDDKRNQHFLKSQEKRRIALQHELLKAQMSPLTVSVVRVTKLNQHESIASPGTRSPSTATMMAIVNRHGDRAGEHHKDNDANSSNARATAANHRRIMMLRKQRSAPSKDRHEAAAAQQLGKQFETASLPTLENRESDTDVVNVRFTFSRERRPDPATNGDGDALSLDSATCFDNGGQSDNLFALGAFSPAVELESALDALEMGPVEPETVLSPTLDEDGAGVPDAEEELDSPHSPLMQSRAFTEEEINAVMFSTSQDSIDLIADAFSEGVESANPNNAQVIEEKSDHQPETHEADQIVAAPPFTEDIATEVPVAAIDSSIRDLSAPVAETIQDASGSHTDSPAIANADSPEIAEVAKSDCNRILCNGELGNQNSAAATAIETVNDLEETSTLQDGDFVAVVLISPTDPQLTSATDAIPMERGGDTPAAADQEPQDPEYDEENFDDDVLPSLSEPNGDFAKENPILSDEASLVEVSSSVDAGDEASGYGSEFDEDQDQLERHEQQQQEENFDIGEKRLSDPEEDLGVAHRGDYEDEHYDDQYSEDEQEPTGDAHGEVADDVRDCAHQQKEEELSYSDDDFSEGEDT